MIRLISFKAIKIVALLDQQRDFQIKYFPKWEVYVFKKKIY
jgi:hypothetical protein